MCVGVCMYVCVYAHTQTHQDRAIIYGKFVELTENPQTY